MEAGGFFGFFFFLAFAASFLGSAFQALKLWWFEFRRLGEFFFLPSCQICLAARKTCLCTD